ncbi:SPOR domain-containing protein [Ideonella sp. B7]|uniref:SPOR domain-containing protein n=1 Tax=Ideonella benzenivorans TaxID=2831643 RepID=UPI001CED04C1|nr:SPOR domain-containing protein [Ideonella benzenivorans]MCA6218502.1 SPOR domain-containing protein [Ideonella benzenivorans]
MKLGSGARRGAQRGGFVLGIIVGLLVGLAIALGVALYIAKVPVPFMDKVGHRTPEQEAQEAEKLKTWDPNAGLAGKQAPRPVMPASEPATEAAPAPRTAGAASSPVPVAVVGKPVAAKPAASAASATASPKPKHETRDSRDPAAILAGEPVSSKADKPAKTDKPAEPAAAGGDAFIYFVQAGAYSNSNDAEQQRARLAMQGLVAKVSEREQAGRTVYRVRLGPFDSRDEAERQQDRLKGAGLDSALVRVERNHP